MSKPCQHATLSTGALGSVEVCAQCAIVHVAVGAVTLRLTEESFRDLGRMVAQAQRQLDAAAAASAPFVMPPVGRIQ